MRPRSIRSSTIIAATPSAAAMRAATFSVWRLKISEIRSIRDFLPYLEKTS